MPAPAQSQTHPQTQKKTKPAPNPTGDKKNLKKAIRNIAIATLSIGVLNCFWKQTLVVPSESMEPTIKTGSIILSNPLAYGFSWANLPLGSASENAPKLFSSHTPQRGDIIISRLNSFQGRKIIKRVIGVPGDTIETDGKSLKINNIKSELKETKQTFACDHSNTKKQCKIYEEYIKDILPKHRIAIEDESHLKKISIKIPEKEYFVMGDNREHSQDSRYSEAEGTGLVHLSRIIGQYVYQEDPGKNEQQ